MIIWDNLRIIFIKDDIQVNSNTLAKINFEVLSENDVKSLLADVYSFMLLENNVWDSLDVNLNNYEEIVSSETITYVNFENQVGTSSIGEVLYEMYVSCINKLS